MPEIRVIEDWSPENIQEKTGWIPDVGMRPGGLIGVPTGGADPDLRRALMAKALGAAGRGPTTMPEQPEVVTAPGVPPLARAGMAAPTAKQRKEILQEQVPGVQFDTDQFGVEFAVMPSGERYPLNQPGLSTQDIAQLGPELALTSGVAALTKGIGRTTARVGTTALGMAAQSALQDKLAQMAGASDGVNTSRAIIAAVGSLAGDTILGAADLAMRMALMKSKRLYRPGKGFTSAGRKQLREQVGAETARTFSNKKLVPILDEIHDKSSHGITDAGDAASLAAMRSRGVAATYGQGGVESGSARQIQLLTQKGTFGDEPKQILDEGIEAAEESLGTTALRTVQGDIGTGAIARQGQSARVLQHSLLSRRDASLASVDQLYDEARALGARVNPESLKGFVEANKDMRTAFNTRQGKARYKELKRLSKEKNLSFQDLENWLRDAKKIRRASSDGVVIGDMTQMINRVNAGLNSGNISVVGSDQALDLYRRARTAMATHVERFEHEYRGGRKVQNIVHDLVSGGRRAGDALSVSPEDAAGELVGFIRQGIQGKANITRELAPLIREMGGRSSTQWKRFKEEVFLELVKPGRLKIVGNRSVMDGAQIRRDWLNARRNEGMNEFLSTVFGPRDLARIDQYVDDAFAVSRGVQAADITEEMRRRYRRRTRGLPFLSQPRIKILELMPFYDKLIESSVQRAGRLAQSGQLPARNIIQPGVGAIVGATAAQQYESE